MHYNNTHITFCVCVCNKKISSSWSITAVWPFCVSSSAGLLAVQGLTQLMWPSDAWEWQLWIVACCFYFFTPCEIWLFLDNLGQFTNPRLWSLHQSQSKPAIFVEGDQVISLFELLTGLWNQDCLSERKMKNGLEFHWECALVSLLD